MARLRYNGLTTTLGAALTNSATSVTFGAALTYANGTAVPTITGSDYIPLAILDSSGHLSEVVWLTAYTSAATTGTIARGKEGTSGVAHSSGDKVVHGPFADDATGGALACTAYTPATNYTTSSTTAVQVDSTNLIVSFVAPQSGKVVVQLSALCNGPGSPNYAEWSLFESGAQIPGTIRQFLNSSGALIITISTMHVVTGLTPGSSHTYAWGWRVSAPSATIYGAPVTMLVTALP
jgi:hypothetical protein